MKINVVGGGPSGLFFSILMKRMDPRHEIVVFERNPPDATFGWGVVFSEGTLSELRDADYDTYLEITQAFATWDTIETHHQDHTIRSRGHRFSAISRKVLLGILQRRARELRVPVHFEVEIDDPDEYADADVLVGADGVNSTVRPWRADVFEPTVFPYPSRFIWFGTDRVFDAFTFVFRPTEHGMFQAHIYPFDATTSTFIVETNEDSWRRAGLEGLSEEESIEFCQELFARELGGHRLLSNRSTWLCFQSIKNKRWHGDNVVLLGDAAHTAHWSIGSGTKLAMEDSVALANAFVRHPADIRQAFVDYEMARQPVVEPFQEAARESAAWLEGASQYARYQPLQFGFTLLTRSGRISYTNLELRDPHFVRQLDTWFGAANADDGRVNGRTVISPPPLFAPLRLPGLEVPNRVVQAPVGEAAEPDGCPGEADAERLVRSARTGVGLVLTGLVAVIPEGRTTPRCPMLASDPHTAAWREIVEAVHDAEARICLQLGHAGRRGSTRPRELGMDIPLRTDGWPLLSASPIPYATQNVVPREMDHGDIARVREEFAAAATRAAEAGFDALELHLGQGYLLHSFLSPLANQREDEYGGSHENRLRFPLEVLNVVREHWPKDRVLAACVPATDCSRHGLTVEDGVRIARAVRDRGCDLVHVTAGQIVPETRVKYRRGFLTQLSDRIRTEAAVPTLVGGYLTTFDEINTAVAAGRADLCILETPFNVRTGVEPAPINTEAA